MPYPCKAKTCRRFKVLFLHDYNQDSIYFHNKIHGFRRNVSRVCYVNYADAPHVVPSEIVEAMPETITLNAPHEMPLDGMRFEHYTKPGRCWWFSREDSKFCPTDQTDIVKGFEESVNHVKAIFRHNGPFDGILGFGQGAALASLLCGMNETEFPSFKFVILVAGYPSLSPYHQRFYQAPLKQKSLHIIGETDAVVSNDMSRSLVSLYENPEVIYHYAGHLVPKTKHVKNTFKAFLKNQMDHLCSL